MQGPVEARYALCPSRTDPYAAADDALLPLLATTAAGGGDRARRGQGLTVAGAELSAVRREGEALEVRVFNPTASPTWVSLGGRSGHLVDLVGREVASFENGFELGPWKVATARPE
jgi:hypothetical protein